MLGKADKRAFQSCKDARSKAIGWVIVLSRLVEEGRLAQDFAGSQIDRRLGPGPLLGIAAPLGLDPWGEAKAFARQNRFKEPAFRVPFTQPG